MYYWLYGNERRILVEQSRSIHEVELEAFRAATLHHSTPFTFVDFQSSCYEQRLTGAPSDTMDTQSNGTFPESEQPGSAVAKGSYPRYRHAVSDLSRSLTLSHISQHRPGTSAPSGTSSRRGNRPRSDLPSRVKPYPIHPNRTTPATGNSAYTVMRASREAKEPQGSYFLEIASEIREFKERWTTLDDAPTPELHKLVVKVRPLVREYFVRPNERTKNELSYHSVSLLGKDETEQRSILLELIPSLETELAGSKFDDFDGLIVALTGWGVMSLICTLADSY
jgi:hypothetical protein